MGLFLCQFEQPKIPLCLDSVVSANWSSLPYSLLPYGPQILGPRASDSPRVQKDQIVKIHKCRITPANVNLIILAFKKYKVKRVSRISLCSKEYGSSQASLSLLSRAVSLCMHAC